jgi:L-ascorbate metabolism protein UlaG (beta-lactamase superfamily)
MDKLTQRQRQIDAVREKIVTDYPRIWERMISEWKQPSEQDCAWLMYSANYLFRTSNIRWAVDPFSLHARLPDTPALPIEQDLQELDFVLLTHRHADHLDLDLIRRLSHYHIQWIIPKSIIPYVTEHTGLSVKKVITPDAFRNIEIKGIEIHPFDSMHWEWESSPSSRSVSNAAKGLPETGYRITFDGKKWLFPGDIRTYDPALLPSLGLTDIVFAHLWLGRGQALKVNPEMVNKFCRFYLHLKPRRIIVTHLYELGRAAKSLWTADHYNAVKRKFSELSPGTQVDMTSIGDRILLSG